MKIVCIWTWTLTAPIPSKPPHPNPPQQKRWNILSGSPPASINIHLYLTNEKQLKKSPKKNAIGQWIGLREYLPETSIFHGKKNMDFRCRFSLKPNHCHRFGAHFLAKNGGATQHATGAFLARRRLSRRGTRRQSSAPAAASLLSSAAAIRRPWLGPRRPRCGALVSHRGGENMGRTWTNMGKTWGNGWKIIWKMVGKDMRKLERMWKDNVTCGNMLGISRMRNNAGFGCRSTMTMCAP